MTFSVGRLCERHSLKCNLHVNNPSDHSNMIQITHALTQRDAHIVSFSFAIILIHFSILSFDKFPTGLRPAANLSQAPCFSQAPEGLDPRPPVRYSLNNDGRLYEHPRAITSSTYICKRQNKNKLTLLYTHDVKSSNPSPNRF